MPSSESAPRNQPDPNLPRPAMDEVLLAGYLNAGCGLGETARLIWRACEEARLRVHPHVFQLAHAQVAAAHAGDPRFFERDGPCLVSMNADNLPKFGRQAGSGFLDARPIVGIWFWETSSPPEYADRGYPLVDEIWTCSQFVRDTFAGRSPVPVRVIPHPIDISALERAVVPDAFAWPGRFVFLFAFDYFSGVERKNPQALCEAFRRAFPEPGRALPCGRVPMLIIKSINGHRNPLEHQRVVAAAGNRPDIHLMDDFLSSVERNGLARRADAYVSLHRAEGLGLTLLEAMALGKPCVATAYSGNLDFMSETNSFPVDFHEIEVGPGSLHYPAADKWADPDIGHAARQMITLATRPEHAAALAARGREEVMARHSPEAVGKIIRGYLEELCARPPRAKDLFSVLSPHTRASRLLGPLRQSVESRQKRLVSNGRKPTPPGTLEAINADLLELTRVQRLTLKALKEKEAGLNQRLSRLEQLLLREAPEAGPPAQRPEALPDEAGENSAE